ncbi:MlaD family protein [Gordonia sp. LSe1-13]|uniref:MlaD family protein n=1 Tax=Gordonia sesuvii TaxID=3116777 RepID=A0ABU7M934_9ACTN|nr:MlaD family protein [Gordonia sp. LSe1-13]
MVIALCIAVSGCTAGFSQIPTADSTDDTYSIRMEFENVLNLPDGAAVLSDGTEVGSLTSVVIDEGGYVVAEAAIDDGVRLSADTRATLEQAAPLADVRVALTTPDEAGAQQLQPGDTIPLAQTEQAPQIEDTLAQLATAVGQGTFTNFMTTVRQMNKAFPNDPEVTRKIFDVLGTNFEDLAANQDSLSAVLDGLTATTKTIKREEDVIGPLLTPEGAQHTTDAMTSTLSIVFMMTNLGMIAPPAQWVAPMVQSMDNTARAIVPVLFAGNPIDTSRPSNARKLIELLDEKIIPFATAGPKVDITQVEVTGAGPPLRLRTGERRQQIITVMRMIGMIR